MRDLTWQPFRFGQARGGETTKTRRRTTGDPTVRLFRALYAMVSGRCSRFDLELTGSVSAKCVRKRLAALDHGFIVVLIDFR